MSNIIVLGIAGGSGSGKTTLMKNLIARFQDDVTVLSHDNYYRPYDELTIEERSKLNYDHPDAFDTDMMIGHLKELKAGHSIECPVYDYATYSRTNETVTVEPRKVILVEGILIFENRALPCRDADGSDPRRGPVGDGPRLHDGAGRRAGRVHRSAGRRRDICGGLRRRGRRGCRRNGRARAAHGR